MLYVFLKICFVHLASNETLGVEDCVGWVGMECVLGGVTDQSFFVCETDPRRSCSMPLIVGDNLNTTVPVYTVPTLGKRDKTLYEHSPDT